MQAYNEHSRAGVRRPCLKLHSQYVCTFCSRVAGYISQPKRKVVLDFDFTASFVCLAPATNSSCFEGYVIRRYTDHGGTCFIESPGWPPASNVLRLKISIFLSLIRKCRVAAPSDCLSLRLLFVLLLAPTIDFRYPVRHHLQTVGSRSQISPQSAMRRTSALLENTCSSVLHILMCTMRDVPHIGSVHRRSILVTRLRRRCQSILVLFSLDVYWYLSRSSHCIQR